MMRYLTILVAILLLSGRGAWALGPTCDDDLVTGTGDVCTGGSEDLATQSYKLSFIDSLTGSLCSDADKGAGSMWIAGDFIANPLIGYLPVICLTNAGMVIDTDFLALPHGTLTGAARRAAGLNTASIAEYDCTDEEDAGRAEVQKGSNPPFLKWCHWDGATASDAYAALSETSDGIPVNLNTTSEMDSTCDVTGVFTNGDTAITLTDYFNDGYKSLITATISFTAAVANTFTIKANLEGSQVGSNVTCFAATGFSTSCTISIIDTDVGAGVDRTFTVTVAQSTGVLNTIDTCNVTRLTVHN